jgi:RNA polymerase sigma-70 factor (ECF subfamily)
MEGVGSSLTLPPHPQEGLQSWEIELAQGIVRRFLASSKTFPVLDYDDLFQECLLHWWTQRQRYRKERGASPGTYMRRLLNAKLVDLTREAKAAKRGCGRITDSLDREVGEEKEDGLVLGDLVPGNVDVEAESSLRVDLQRGVALLTERQRLVIRTLAAGWRITDISRRSGLSRDTLYEELHRIRQVFRDAGLKEYLS